MTTMIAGRMDRRGASATEAALARAGGVMVGAKGTLAPDGDQSKLLKRLRGHADVVGSQGNLEDLLSRVAVPFAKRYARK